jgi:hypothetical protein
MVVGPAKSPPNLPLQTKRKAKISSKNQMYGNTVIAASKEDIDEWKYILLKDKLPNPTENYSNSQ